MRAVFRGPVALAASVLLALGTEIAAEAPASAELKAVEAAAEAEVQASLIPTLPVVDPGVELDPPLPTRDASIRNPITWADLNNILTPNSNSEGLTIDIGDTAFDGTVFTGPYPVEYGRTVEEVGQADYDYMAFRFDRSLTDGVGSLRIDNYFKDKYNANAWPDGQCDNPNDCPTRTVGYRLHLLSVKDDGTPFDQGFYDSRISFTGTESGSFEAALTINEGPFINQVKSNGARRVMIAFGTNKECLGSVAVRENGQTYNETGSGLTHEIWLTGLSPNSEYHYQAFCNGDEVRSGVYHFRTAPVRGDYPTDDGRITVVFGSDSREGAGGGDRRYMGSNLLVVKSIANQGYQLDNADLVIFGGDLINGYTSEVEDFRLQLKGFKQGWEGLWRHVPVYTAMGNHESLLNAYDNGSRYGLSLDKWPYETDSAEAVFAQEFYNPTNGPEPQDKRRPQYTENVYGFQYGPAVFIAFNNNYWWTTNDKVAEFGGSPEGYMMDDQLRWIERALVMLEGDETVKYIFLYAQEPVFPNGGHVKDAMWWNGDNNIRAYTKRPNGRLRAEDEGIIEVRNRFWKAIAQSSKVAAVLTGDEHGYHSMVVDNTTPVGLMSDDTDGDGVIDWAGAEPASPNPDFKYPTWHITAGNAGAPWYAKEQTPWSDKVKLFSSQIGYTVLDITSNGVELRAYSLEGGLIQHEEDLMSVKK